jgi:ketosteroid isomerase-like protein
MKKNVLLLLFFILALLACQQQPDIEPLNIEAEEAAINDLLNKMTTAFKDQDVENLMSIFAEDLLLCGSDPSEFWNKQQVTDMWTQMLTQPVEIKVIGEPIIKIAPDGNSASAVQQYLMPVISEKLQFRNGYHLIKVKDNWLIFTSNTACIPKNEDLPKINEVISN